MIINVTQSIKKVMNKRDCNNLSVIIQKKIEGDDALNDWLETLSEDDLYYALDVLLEYRSQKENFETIIDQHFN